MASVSALPVTYHSPFDSIPDYRPLTPSAHTRRHSRNTPRSVAAPPLPAFSFNPGATSDSTSQQDTNTASAKGVDMATAPEAPRRANRPPPLPAFSFNPGAELAKDLTPSPTHPILEEMALNQQRTSRSARPAPLPAFTFAPGSTNTPQRSPSPTKSSFGDALTSQRSGAGHRRHGSEFVGGGADGTQLISTSPQKSESRVQGPPITSLNPRGHAHRRSQAVSISEIDTSELIKANAVAKHLAGSAPSTPSDVQPRFFSHSPQRQSMSYTESRSPAASPRRRGSAPGIRPRVGFSDNIDVIPRPLSLISSETDGSTSTIRANHSVSGSINSIATSPNPRLSQALAPSPFNTEFSPRRRPVTADPMTYKMDWNTASERSAVVSLPKRPLSASGSPVVTTSGSPPNKKKHFWFSHSADNSPSPTPNSEKHDPLSALPPFSPTLSGELVRPKTSPERNASIKRRKVRTWTNGIFSRKGRPRSTKVKVKSKRAPITVLSRPASDHLNEIFDADNTVVIQNSPSPIARTHSAPATRLLSTRISEGQHQVEDHVTSPVLDLDAALGPFGSEEKLNEVVSRSAAARIAKLHSAERRGATDAFGAFHRRSESAPQMPPMNRSTFGIHHMASNTSLSQDVFDEEEEDNFLAGEMEADTDGSVFSKEERSIVMDASSSPDPETQRKHTATSLQTPADGLALTLGPAATDGIVIVDAEEDFVTDRARSSNSTLEAPVRPEAEAQKRPASSPMEFAYSAARTTYASSTEGRTATNSLISSPDAEHVSFDEQPRFNRYLGEPNPEVGLRVSNDDLPSLTDSVSTSNLPRFSSSANTRSSVEQRSASVSVPVVSKPGNAWKRASLASLNRLIPGSSNGSKLRFETMAEPAEDDKIKKRSNRLSKLMHFWRSKEKVEK